MKRKTVPERELSWADGVPTRCKLIAIALRLNAHGSKVQQIASYLNWHEHTVKNTLRRWPQKGLGRLWETPGRGPKRRWSEEDGQTVEQWVEEPCRYSVRQISQKLLEDRFLEIARGVTKRPRR
ncbi:helix-turn-helix domain-containing protein [Microcoleus sp. B4-D4]|uniref:helix-turn-helix domain-containing protein n=1 Tax=Microcoleus sp. B4-D4 TaxID=2818667 RepID=UPI002FCEB452